MTVSRGLKSLQPAPLLNSGVRRQSEGRKNSMGRKRADQTTGNRETLLRAVCERPEDDPPRLAYAECLETTGDQNDAAHAEFIRVQLELARLVLPDKRWGKLQARQKALERHCDRWADELPKLDGVRWNSIDLRRGFVWDVWCDDAEAFRQCAALIFASAPIQGLRFMRLTAIEPVMDVPEVSRLWRLILEDFRLTPTDARALASSQNGNNLTALHLSGNRFGDLGAKALAASRHLLCLDNLDLGHNRIGDEGVAALADSPVVASLSHLGLGGNPLTNIGALALTSSPHLNRLTGMTLWGCKKIGAEGKQALKARFGETVSFED